MTIDEETLRHPEIVNPYGLSKDSFIDKAFVVDLSLSELLASVPFHSAEDSKKFAEEVLINYACSSDTVEYRQAILNDLISDANLRIVLRGLINGLNELEYKLESYRNKPNLSNGLDLLRGYKNLIDNTPDLKKADSKGLQSVSSYWQSLRRSDSFSGLHDLLERIDNAEGVDFRVYLDKDGSPQRMSALELADRKPGTKPRIPLVSRLIGKAEQGQSLKHWGGDLNPVGRVISEYMDKQFTPVIGSYVAQIVEVTNFLEPLDFYVGFAEYFIKLREMSFDVCRPTLLPLDSRRMRVRNARNPLLLETRRDTSRNVWFRRIRSRGNKVVPNDIEYTNDKNMFIITGPNNGGKTTYVKTVGLIQLMSQKGLFAPAESAELSFVDGIYTHFVTPEDITKGEGRYKNELRRIREIFERATPYSLVILDEPCGGTSHEEGERQSLALLDGFHRLSTATFFTTHMHRLAKEVDSGRFQAAKNLYVECTYESKRINYTYKVKEGSFGRSFGEEIAKELGLMPEDIEETVSKKARVEGYGEMLRE